VRLVRLYCAFILLKCQQFFISFVINLQGGAESKPQTFVHILSSPNIDRFSKFSHRHILWKICNKVDVVTKYTTKPQLCCTYVLWLNGASYRKTVQKSNRKWRMGNQMATWPITSRDPRSWSWPNRPQCA